MASFKAFLLINLILSVLGQAGSTNPMAAPEPASVPATVQPSSAIAVGTPECSETPRPSLPLALPAPPPRPPTSVTTVVPANPVGSEVAPHSIETVAESPKQSEVSQASEGNHNQGSGSVSSGTGSDSPSDSQSTGTSESGSTDATGTADSGDSSPDSAGESEGAPQPPSAPGDNYSSAGTMTSILFLTFFVYQ